MEILLGNSTLTDDDESLVALCSLTKFSLFCFGLENMANVALKDSFWTYQVN